MNANASGLLATQQGLTTPFQVHADSAPNFCLDANPAADSATTRTFERAWSKGTAVNPKQLNAGVGEFAVATLTASTKGITSDAPGDSRYRQTTVALNRLGAARDHLAQQIADLLDGAAFHGTRLDRGQVDRLTYRAEALIKQAQHLAAG